MPEEESLSFADMEASAKHKLCEMLSRTFDDIAKLAMRASSEFSTDVENRSVRERLINAHSIVTLIIEDAMRGLGEATTSAMVYAGMAAMQTYGESEDSSPH
jgi:hypothetical protein